MYSDEDTELRDIVIQNLENCGFLNKVKAELRAGVFLALEDEGCLKSKIPLFNEKFEEYVKTPDGKVILSIVREFLEYFNLNFTLSVFDPEVALSVPFISRADLCDKLKLHTSENEGPIIHSLLKDKINVDVADEKCFGNCNAKSSQEIEESTFLTNSSALTAITEKDTSGLSTSFLNKLKPESDDVNISTYNIANNKTFLIDSTKEVTGSIVNSDVNNGNATSEKYKEKISIKSSGFGETIPPQDPFFDEPLPSEKETFFNFTDTFKDKSHKKSVTEVKNYESGRLSSLKDLPSLTTNEWSYSRDAKNTLSSLESVTSSEASNEEIINLDVREKKGDFDVAESNEETSEKQISEESIEEAIEEDFSATLDDLLNNSLADDTTDQTVSQVSVLDGVDHVEPCNS